VIFAGRGIALLRVERTTVEHADTLLGMDVPNPKLSWVLSAERNDAAQTAYQVQVNGTWDSGKVPSDRTVAVPYAGPPLRPRTRYEWRVRVWDTDDRPSPWSDTSWWETGLLGEPWQAQWIGAPPPVVGTVAGPRRFRSTLDIPRPVEWARLVADDCTLYLNGQLVTNDDVTHLLTSDRLVLAAVAESAGLLVRLVVNGHGFLVTGDGWRVSDTSQPGWAQPGFDDSDWPQAWVRPEAPAPVLRKEFTLTDIGDARLYISGLGYYEAFLNGQRVGTQVLDPGYTDYDKTVLYATHDVTDLLVEGRNAIEVTLGRGFYGVTTQTAWDWHKASWHGEPRLLAQLEINSSVVAATGPDWQQADSPTVSNSLYAGETHDARTAETWRPATVLEPPKGTLRAQLHEPVEIVETVVPAITRPRPGVCLADMGRTMAGWAELTVEAPEGTRILLRYGEKLADDGSVMWQSRLVPGRHQTDEYVCAGGGVETWEPRFTYKGFRYVEITGARPQAVLGKVVHTKVAETGFFRCSEPFFEELDRAMRRTIRNNLHGIPTDTPMYEKNGWTGDVHVAVPAMTFAFDMRRLLTKWLNDVRDSQTPAGQVPVIVPSGGWGYADLGPSPEWTTVYPYLLREMYRVYGDEELVADHWPAVARYLDWEIDRLEDGLALTELGDYLSPGRDGNPPEDPRLTATAYLCRGLTCAAEIGDLLGHKDVADRYRTIAEVCRGALNRTFLRDGYYRHEDTEYRQTSNAVPLAFGLVPADDVPSVVESLVADVRARGNHLNTGALGTSVLLPVLTAHGHADVAYALATQRTYPSWGFWFDNGADTMWEMWEATSRSRDHYFQGTVVQWLYENVAGLRPGDAGYRRFTVRPDVLVGVDWAEAAVMTVRGLVSVNWEKNGSTVHVRVHVPVGCTAEVFVPGVSTRVGAGDWTFMGDLGHPGFGSARNGNG
jgi:alpha-L-rhamnosidase